MSRRKSPILINEEFISRFIEICGTSQPTEIKGILEISYGAAKNYLQGKLPETIILLAIAEKTDFSIHWLLTGKGPKTVSSETNRNLFDIAELIASKEMEEKIREVCAEEISKYFEAKSDSLIAETEIVEIEDEYSTTTLILPFNKIIDEKVIEETPKIFSEKLD
jgi:hypothetical protein